MAYATSGQDYLFLPIMTERTRSLANYGMYFVELFYKFAGTNCLANVLKYIS
jgi:hypothetical protein